MFLSVLVNEPPQTSGIPDSRTWLRSAAHDPLAIMLVLAAEPNRIAGSLLALRARIPTARVDQAVRRLSQADLLIAHRGRTGGYLLRRPASTISLLEILDAGMAHTEGGGDQLFAGLSTTLRTWLRGVTLADVVSRRDTSQV